ncbi:MAG: hypothetical protein WC792_05375 [Candidatus Micrarchaeia archaeon]|jgi:uncharacterized coiled-coil DUF342 family protein
MTDAAKVSEAKALRDLANKQAHELSAQNRERLAEYNKLLETVSLEKKKRDECNAKANDARKKRGDSVKALLHEKNAFFAKLEALKEFEAVRVSAKAAKERLDAAEWRLQTEGTTAEKEKRFSAQTRELEKTFIAAQKKELLQAEATDLKAAWKKSGGEADALSKIAAESSAEADSHHRKMLETYASAEKLRERISKTFSELDAARQKADELHGQFLGAAGEFSKQAAQERQELEREKRGREQEKKGALQARAKKLFEEFKAGKALSAQDLMLLQDAGVL